MIFSFRYIGALLPLRFALVRRSPLTAINISLPALLREFQTLKAHSQF